MATSSIVVTGAAETEAALTEFGTVKVPREMRRGLAAGAKIMRRAIRAEGASSFLGHGRKNPGGLAKSVSYKSKRVGGLLTTVVGPLYERGGQHRSLVIVGHQITRSKIPVEGHYRRPAWVAAGNYGYTRPNDFVRRGEDASAGLAQEAITAAFAKAIETAGKP